MSALGAVALRTGDWRPALAAGLAGGVGYLARPEAILAPAALGLAWVCARMRSWNLRALVASGALPAMGLSALVFVGGYALIKGQVTEKLALRHAASLGSQQVMIRTVPQLLPKGLNDPRWDFSPKEDSDRTVIRHPLRAVRWMALRMVGRALLGFRRHGHLGPGAAAIHLETLPGPGSRRSGRL